MGFDYDSGEVRWTYTSDVPVLTLRGTGSPMIIADNAVAGFADGKVVAVNLRSGNVAWEARVAIPQGTSEIERIVDIDGSMALQGSCMWPVIKAGLSPSIPAQAVDCGSATCPRYRVWAWVLAMSM